LSRLSPVAGLAYGDEVLAAPKQPSCKRRNINEQARLLAFAGRDRRKGPGKNSAPRRLRQGIEEVRRLTPACDRRRKSARTGLPDSRLLCNIGGAQHAIGGRVSGEGSHHEMGRRLYAAREPRERSGDPSAGGCRDVSNSNRRSAGEPGTPITLGEFDERTAPRRCKGSWKAMRISAIALTAALTAFAVAPAALAQNAPATPPPAAGPAEQKPPAPTLEPRAVEILKAASAKLASAKTMAFTAISTYERSARNGQPLYYSSIHEVTVERPDKMRVITPGDGTPDEFYYNGKTMMAYVPSTNMVAVADAPPTLDKLLDEAWDKAAIYFPFSDVLASDPYAELSKTLKSAFYVGRSIAVGGVPTEMIALAGEEVAAEVWIGVVDHLPRQVRVVYANEPAQARYQTAFSDWRLNIPVPAGTFSNPKAAKAEHIDFAPPGDAEAPPEVKQPSGEKKP
jgi:hypothetical protein